MTENELRIAEFERYIVWRLDQNSYLVQSTNFTVNNVDFNIRLFSENQFDPNVSDFTNITDFLQAAEDTFFTVQDFTDQNGVNFGKITFWDFPEISLTSQTQVFTVKKLLLLESSFDNESTYELIAAI